MPTLTPDAPPQRKRREYTPLAERRKKAEAETAETERKAAESKMKESGERAAAAADHAREVLQEIQEVADKLPSGVAEHYRTKAQGLIDEIKNLTDSLQELTEEKLAKLEIKADVMGRMVGVYSRGARAGAFEGYTPPAEAAAPAPVFEKEAASLKSEYAENPEKIVADTEIKLKDIEKEVLAGGEVTSEDAINLRDNILKEAKRFAEANEDERNRLASGTFFNDMAFDLSLYEDALKKQGEEELEALSPEELEKRRNLAYAKFLNAKEEFLGSIDDETKKDIRVQKAMIKIENLSKNAESAILKWTDAHRNKIDEEAEKIVAYLVEKQGSLPAGVSANLNKFKTELRTPSRPAPEAAPAEAEETAEEAAPEAEALEAIPEDMKIYVDAPERLESDILGQLGEIQTEFIGADVNPSAEAQQIGAGLLAQARQYAASELPEREAMIKGGIQRELTAGLQEYTNALQKQAESAAEKPEEAPEAEESFEELENAVKAFNTFHDSLPEEGAKLFDKEAVKADLSDLMNSEGLAIDQKRTDILNRAIVALTGEIRTLNKQDQENASYDPLVSFAESLGLTRSEFELQFGEFEETVTTEAEEEEQGEAPEEAPAEAEDVSAEEWEKNKAEMIQELKSRLDTVTEKATELYGHERKRPDEVQALWSPYTKFDAIETLDDYKNFKSEIDSLINAAEAKLAEEGVTSAEDEAEPSEEGIELEEIDKELEELRKEDEEAKEELEKAKTKKKRGKKIKGKSKTKRKKATRPQKGKKRAAKTAKRKSKKAKTTRKKAS